MTNYPTKYESFRTNDLRGDHSQSITILKLHENVKVP